jgi:hypothetical protein
MSRLRTRSAWGFRLLGGASVLALLAACSEVDIPSPLPKTPTPTPLPTATPTPTPVPTPTPIPIPKEVRDPDRAKAERFLEKARREAMLRTQEVQEGIFKAFPLIVPGQTVELSASSGVEFSGKLLAYTGDFVALEFQGQRRYIPTRQLPHTQKLQIYQDLRKELVQLESAITGYQALKRDPVFIGDRLPLYLTYGELLEIGYPEVLLEHARLREELGDLTYSFFVYGFLAKRDLPGAVHELGRFYAEGIGMPPDYPKALRILEKARDLGHPDSAELINLIQSIDYFEAEERDFRIATEYIRVPCSRCGGRGVLPKAISGTPLPCNTCRGTGQIQKRVLKKVPLD